MKKYLTAIILVMGPLTTQMASAAEPKAPAAQQNAPATHRGMMGGGMAHGAMMDASQHEKMAAIHKEVAQCLRDGKSQADCSNIMMQAQQVMCAGKDPANCPAGMNMNMYMMGRSEVLVTPAK